MFIYESVNDELDDIFNIFLEASSGKTFIMHDYLYPVVESVLSTPAGDARFKKLVNNFVDRNIDKLNAEGPVSMVTFGDNDKNDFFNLFNLNPSEVSKKIKQMLGTISSKAQFKLINSHPLFIVLYMCIRFYSLKKDNKGLNAALAIFYYFIFD